MPRNAYRIVVDLPKSDGFHTVSDYLLAKIAEEAITDALIDRFSSGGCVVRIETATPPAGEH